MSLRFTAKSIKTQGGLISNRFDLVQSSPLKPLGSNHLRAVGRSSSQSTQFKIKKVLTRSTDPNGTNTINLGWNRVAYGDIGRSLCGIKNVYDTLRFSTNGSVCGKTDITIYDITNSGAFRRYQVWGPPNAKYKINPGSIKFSAPLERGTYEVTLGAIEGETRYKLEIKNAS